MKNKIYEINTLRAIASLSVVMVHISSIAVYTFRSDSIHIILASLLNRGLKFTTPTFIFISGFTLFYSTINQEFKAFSFLKRRFVSTLIPYIIWTMVYYAYFIHQGIYIFSLEFLIDNLIYAQMSYHLYFIAIIMQFYFAFGIIQYLFKRFNPHIILTIFLAISLFTMKYINDFQYADRFFIRYIFFFGLGCYIAIFIEQFKAILAKYKHYTILAYIIMTLYYSYQFYIYHALEKYVNLFLIEITWLVFATTSILFLFNLCTYIVNNKKKLNHFLNKISNSSYYIYLAHPLVLYMSEHQLDKRFIMSISTRFVINTLVVYGLTVPLSLAYSYAKKHIGNIRRENNMISQQKAK